MMVHDDIITIGKKSFTVQYVHIGHDTIQLDIQGQGVLKYQEKISDELIIEINTNIQNSLTRYGKSCGHNPADIGYTFDLKQRKKYNREHDQGETEISLYIVFKSPVKGASAYSLTPTIRVISTLVLGEIFKI